MSLAAVTLALIFHRDLRRLSSGSLGYGVLIGTLLGIGNELQTSGLKYTMPSKSAFLTGVAVVLVPLFLALFWKRTISRWSTLGVVMAFVGLYLLTVPASGLNLQSMNHGDLLTLSAALVFAFHIIYLGHAAQLHRWRQIAVVQTATAAVLMIIAVPLAEKVYVLWSPRVIFAIMITGFLSLALAFSVQAWWQQFIPSTQTVRVRSLDPALDWLTYVMFRGGSMGGRDL